MYRLIALFIMYSHCHFFDNSYCKGEKVGNPHNLAITPSRIATLTAEGKATSMHQLDSSLYYPQLGEGVMPLEFERGIDINDCWEQSQKARRKVKEYVATRANQKSSEALTVD